ncbi:MAG: hypothetical protein R2797_02855 [Gelidibacter sp.]
MTTTTKTVLLALSAWLSLSVAMQAQETPTKDTRVIPVAEDQATQARNTFVNYHNYLLATEGFRFKTELKKVKQTTDFLEYATPENSIRISKYDYLRVVRKAVNQSDTKTEFISKMVLYFPGTEDQFTNTLNLEAFYDTARPKTFYGYFDGLPRIR